MKIILVSQRIDFISDRQETRDSLDQRLSHFVLNAGFLPFPVPNSLFSAIPSNLSIFSDWLSHLAPNGIILSGGNDIGEYSDRDQLEKNLINYALKSQLPLLGICRGMQLLSTHFGGTISAIGGHSGTRHHLQKRKGRTVNSYHKFTISCPTDFKVTETSEDGAIESIQHKLLPLHGWMWHPEREAPFHQDDTSALRDIFSSTKIN